MKKKIGKTVIVPAENNVLGVDAEIEVVKYGNPYVCTCGGSGTVILPAAKGPFGVDTEVDCICQSQ